MILSAAEYGLRRLLPLLAAIAVMLPAVAPIPAAAAPILRPQNESGEIHALVVGIDDYTNVPKLKGAVADARDISNSLRKLGVMDINVLIDQQATREAFLAAMNRLIDSSRPNDLAIITFAGHGAQLPESVKNSKPDHLDEIYVLAKFDRSIAAGFAERVLGPELKHWLKELDRKGVDVLFVADTCHGGGLTRDLDPREKEFSYRSISVAQAAEDVLKSVANQEDSLLDETAFTRVTFLAAVDRSSKAPEVPIEGQSTLRGALSYAVSRALSGLADRHGEGVVSRRDLIEYVRQVVWQYAETRQHIYYEPQASGKLDRIVYRSPPPPKVVTPPAGQTARPLRVAVLNGDPALLAGVRPLVTPFETVADKSAADFLWDARGREAIFAGDVLARGVAADDIPGVADRVAAGRALALLAESRPQTLRLLPDDSLHRRGELLTLEASGLQGKYLVVMNITGDGTTQFLYPRASDSPLVAEPAWRLRFKVNEPYGADQVVVFTSDERLDELEGALMRLDRVRGAGRVPDIVRRSEEVKSMRIGLARVVTAP